MTPATSTPSAAYAIRPERPDDREGIRAVHDAAFKGTAESRIVDALRAAGALTISLVALVNDVIVGHIAFSPVTIDGRDVGALAPVGVLPSHQHAGIGDALCCRGLETARELGVRACVVLGHASYYPRFGFMHAPSTFALRWEGGHDDSFFALELVHDALDGRQGVVRYRPEVS